VHRNCRKAGALRFARTLCQNKSVMKLRKFTRNGRGSGTRLAAVCRVGSQCIERDVARLPSLEVAPERPQRGRKLRDGLAAVEPVIVRDEPRQVPKLDALK